MLSAFAKTNIGQRQVNEDSFLIDETLGLYIVADGVGGMEKGDVASQLACDIIKQNIDEGLTLKEAVYNAHRAIINKIGDDHEKDGMATTVVALLFNESAYELAWVGDSRTYLWDGKELSLITKDDSYVELLLENGHIGIDELETHPDRNVISQALGIQRKEIHINTNSGTLEDNQTLIICSDGLYSISTEIDIINQLKQSKSLEDKTELLVELAVEKDGKDNITLILIEKAQKNKSNHIVVQPKVYREFNSSTGLIKGVTENITKPHNQKEESIDPELTNQTQVTDLNAEEISLIDSAMMQENPYKKPNYAIPIVLILILLVLAFVIF